MYFSASVPPATVSSHAPGKFADGSVVRDSPVGKNLCDCGRRTELNPRHGCEVCRFLDGSGRLEPAVIAVMRQLGRPMTVTEVIEELGVQPKSGKPVDRASIQRLLTRLVASGRMRRFEVELHMDSIGYAADWRTTGARKVVQSSYTCWMYALWG